MNMAVFCASALPAAVLRSAIGSPLDSLHITHAAETLGRRFANTKETVV